MSLQSNYTSGSNVGMGMEDGWSAFGRGSVSGKVDFR